MPTQHYKQLFDQCPLPIWVVDLSTGKVLITNILARDLPLPEEAEGNLSKEILLNGEPARLIVSQDRLEIKRQLSNELHDNISQILAATNLLLDMARSNPAENKEALEKSQENILLAINEIRKLSADPNEEALVTIS